MWSLLIKTFVYSDDKNKLVTSSSDATQSFYLQSRLAYLHFLSDQVCAKQRSIF